MKKLNLTGLTTKDNGKNNKSDLKIYILFSLISFMTIVMYIKYPQLTIRSDGSFQLSRVQEIFENLKSGALFTFISTHTFSHSGVANFVFYPSVFLVPFAILKFFLGPVQAFYVWYGIFVFFTLSIAYYSMKEISKSKLGGVYFALLYTFAGYHIYLGIGNYVLGEFIAYTFIPLVFLGFYNVMLGDYEKYISLSIGMTLLIYSHFLSVALSSAIMLVLALILLMLKKINFVKIRIKALLKSIFIFFILSLWIIYPFIENVLFNKVEVPYKTFTFISTPSEIIKTSLNNTFMNHGGIGFFLVIILFIGFLYFDKLKKYRIFYILGALILLGSTTLIPWIIFRNIPIIVKIFGIIQFPYRLLPYSILFLSFFGSQLLLYIGKKNNITKIIAGSIIILTMLFYFSSTGNLIHNNSVNINKNYLKNGFNKKIPKDKGIDNNNYNDIFNYYPETGATDYYPQSSLKRLSQIRTQSVYANSKRIKSRATYLANKIKFNIYITKKSKIILPVLNYKHTNIHINGKREKKTENDGLISVDLNKKGRYEITVSYNPGKIFYITVYLSLVGWNLIIFKFIKKRWKIIKL